MIIKTRLHSIHEIGQRANQEDSIWPDQAAGESSRDLFILCDGMGGHEAGEVASQAVCAAMSEYVNENHIPETPFTGQDFQYALNAAYKALDAKDNGADKKMGTTLTFVKFHVDGCFVAHIGDSRVYHIRPSEKRILFVSRDHSLINDLMDLGEMTPEEAKTSRQKNIITRAMQPLQEHPATADCRNLTDIRTGDYIYMCSDGMLEKMEDTELVQILSQPVPDGEKVGRLVEATRENRDNHSAHLIRIVSVETDIESAQSRRPRHALGRILSVLLVLLCIGALWLLKIKHII